MFFLKEPQLISVLPAGEVKDPVTSSLFCSRYKVKGMSPCELPWAMQSHVPDNLPLFGCFCPAAASPATPKKRSSAPDQATTLPIYALLFPRLVRSTLKPVGATVSCRPRSSSNELPTGEAGRRQ